jgi:uncharacterized paraquat-inducible protein A
MVLWALLVLAVVMLVIAWMQPLVTVRATADLPDFMPESVRHLTIIDETRSVFSMIHRLVETHYTLIAGLLFFFGIVLPLAKNAGVALVLAAGRGPRAARAAAVLQFIGRFAMVDIFVVAIIVSIMGAGSIGEGDQPGLARVSTVTVLESGLYLFIAYVLLSFVIDALLALRMRRQP